MFVLLVVFVDMLAYSTASPVLPRLVLGIVHGDGAASARAIGLFATAFSLMQFVFGPIQGAVSDRFGRKPVLVVSCLGLALSQAWMATAASVATLLAGRVLAGMAAASIATASAYIADIVPPDERPTAFGRITVAIGVGIIAGPALGGLLGTVSTRAPFWAASAICLANAAWAMFMVPESLPPERRSRFSWRRANSLASLFYLFGSPALRPLATANLLSMLAQQALITVFILSAALRFGFGTGLMGLSLAVLGLFYALVGGLLVRPAIRILGEGGALTVGFSAATAGLLVMAFAPNGLVYLAAIPLYTLLALAGPPVQSAMTRRADAGAQGQLQGANTSITGLAGIGGPAIFAGSLSFALDRLHFAGLPFLLAAVLLAAALPLALRAMTGPGARQGGGEAVAAAASRSA